MPDGNRRILRDCWEKMHKFASLPALYCRLLPLIFPSFLSGTRAPWLAARKGKSETNEYTENEITGLTIEMLELEGITETLIIEYL